MPSPSSGRHQHVQVDTDDSPLLPSSSSPVNSSFSSSSLPSSRHLLLSMNHDVDDEEDYPHQHNSNNNSTHRGSSTGSTSGSAPLHHAGLANGKRLSMGSSRTSPGGGNSSSGRPNGRQGAHQSHHMADNSSSNGLSSLDSHGLHDRDMDAAELSKTSPRHHAHQKLTHQSDGMHSSSSGPSTEQTHLPRRSERLRYSNGHSNNGINGSSSSSGNPHYGSPTHHSERNSYPSRRLSASIHSNNASPSSPTSISTGSASPTASGASPSTPTSPSQYTLPYSHSSGISGHHHHRDKDEPSSGTADLLYKTSSSTSAATSHQSNGRSRTRSKSHPELPNIPLLQSCRSTSVGCSVPMATLFLISMALLGCIFHSNFYRQVDKDNCEFTYMQPKYFKLLGFDRERTAFAGKYGLLLFRDRYDYEVPVPSHMLKEYTNNVYTIDKEAKVRPLGIPALFIPGNAGSAKQVRSIAKEASRYYYETYLPERLRIGSTISRPIDFFTVDFNEEFSALHGHSLMEQAQFLNDAIAYILSLYEDNRSLDPSLPRPTSVLILGHSMGGVVARSLFTMKNYKPGSVNTIVTAATPHMVPPVTLDFEISNIYNTIENYWIRGFLGPDAPLRNVSLVSIAGGNLDIVVNGDSGNIHNLVPQSNGFSVFTSSFPHAWVGADHVAILWCNQIATVIGKTLIDIVDASYSEQVKPLQERMKIFRNRFLTGIEDHIEKATYSSDTESIEMAAIDYTMVDPKHPLVYPPKSSASHDVESANPHFYVIPIPVGSSVDTFNLVTDYSLEVGSRLETLLCVDQTPDSHVSPSSTASTPSTLSCTHDSLSAIPIPASPAQSASSASSQGGARYNKGQEFRFISQKMNALKDAHYVVIKDLGRKVGETGFVIAEFGSEKNSTLTVPTTTLNLWSNGFRMHAFPERPSLVSTLRFPNIDNSLLTYTLTVERQGCRAPQKFAPMMRRSSWLMYEDRYTPNVADQESVDINFHGDIPYFERIQLPGRKGIELRFWMDPSCPVQLSLNLQVDRYGSIGKVLIRYRMVVLVFTYLVVILTLRAQFRAWNRGEPFKPFGMMITQLIQSTFWKFSILLGVIAFLQSLLARTIVSFDPISGSRSGLMGSSAEQEILHGPSGPGGRYPAFPGSREGLDQDAYERMVLARIAKSESWLSDFRLGDVLLGSNDPFFWFLAPVFFQISIGIVILIWMLLNGLVRSVAALLTFVSKRGGRYVIGQTIGNILSKRSRGVRRRVITTIILFIMVATFVPYQFAFVVAVLVHIVSCVRSLLTAQKSSTSMVQAAWNRYHYLMSIFVMFFLLLPCTLPVLMVWIRNLSVQWYEPFSSDHRLDYIAPFIFFVEAITDGAMIPRTPEKGYAAITMGILNFIVFFLILFGVRYSWQIFFMSRIWIVWLLILQLKDTEMAVSLTKSIEHHYSRAFNRPGKKQK